ncbi:hypothetical protein FRACYDRAFT_252633 [Fragilariopsis cylindrus CCMP1102]|uniref:Periplasmic binding protein domain-containing protein n=1 Tax=Fragilariopsis cylindrus CCMP1102 TaxID=635003 RepID=A0A1E7EM45_9STRA|nr:hypothetical protein FRACYDRAFT_252633 [Fragilariopsis cylindrus CCMP1102]|eukprot:OEU07000.1 hypothetical protein FRACYDRAFT_252633 [Fragilariopsis cylindrus CCMP1102]
MVQFFTSFLFILFSNYVVTIEALSSSSSSSSSDSCIVRNSVKIGVVHHGLPMEDIYWEHMNEAITQGAKDMSIDLHYVPLVDGHTLDGQQKIFVEMSAQIKNYCSDNSGSGGDDDDGSIIDALLVTLPNDSILPAVLTCKEKNIKIVVFNVGLDLAERNGLLFVGQDEFEAGYAAGKGLIDNNNSKNNNNNNTSTKIICCTNHSPGNSVLNKRCGGMAKSVVDNNNTYGGQYYNTGVNTTITSRDVSVDPNDCSSFTATIVDQCSPPEGEEGSDDWSTVGLYLAGQASHKCGIEFLREHPEVIATASDVSVELYEGMADNSSGLHILFGIDHQSYLQGYLPFSLLTLAVTNNQAIMNSKIETGPALVYGSPSEVASICQANYYAVCEDKADTNMSSSSDDANIVGIPFKSTAMISNDNDNASNLWGIVLGVLVIVIGLSAFALIQRNQRKNKIGNSVTSTLTVVPTLPIMEIDDIEEATTTSLESKQVD